MKQQINLRRTHPQLYKTIFACGLVYIAIGSLALVTPKHTMLGLILSSLFIVIGVLKLTALHCCSYKKLQVIQSIGLTYSLFYAILFVIAVGWSIDKPETRALAWLIPAWLFWTFTQFLTIIEPPVNPASEKTGEQNGK